MILLPQADLSRQSALADSWGRYYTADWVSQSLVKEMQASRPKVILELGAGRGSLANAAGEKWRHAKVVTVDKDKSAVRFLDRLKDRKHGEHKHHVHDALDDDLANRIGISFGSVDVAVCSPPFVRPRWQTSFGRILEDAGLSGALKSVHDAGADLLFVAQNLRLLRKHGTLGLVLPDGLITGEKFAGVRRILLSEHLVEQVVQLPRRVFERTEAQTYLLVLAKRSGETKSVTLRQVQRDGTVSSPVSIAADVAQRRLDYAYHAANQGQRLSGRENSHKLIRDIALVVSRGSISSHQIAQCDWPVFHLGDFFEDDLVVPKRFQLSQRMLKSLPERVKVAMPGDILVGRIGRNLHKKVAIVQDGPCVVSDCVFFLRVGAKERQPLLEFLTSQVGRQALVASSHGVGARYLTSSDVLDLDLAR